MVDVFFRQIGLVFLNEEEFNKLQKEAKWP